MDDRHIKENARAQICGYMVCKRPNETPEAYFERAKAECVGHMRSFSESVASMTYAEFVASAKARNKALAEATE